MRSGYIIDTDDRYDFVFNVVVITSSDEAVGMFGKDIDKKNFPVGMLTMSACLENLNKIWPEWIPEGHGIVLGLNKNVLAAIPKEDLRRATKKERFLYEMFKEPIELGEHK